eukprot:185377-Rhodomonas_salina.1
MGECGGKGALERVFVAASSNCQRPLASSDVGWSACRALTWSALLAVRAGTYSIQLLDKLPMTSVSRCLGV